MDDYTGWFIPGCDSTYDGQGDGGGNGKGSGDGIEGWQGDGFGNGYDPWVKGHGDGVSTSVIDHRRR